MLLRNYFNWKYNFQYKYQASIGGNTNNYDNTYVLDNNVGLTKISTADNYTCLKILSYSMDGWELVPGNYMFNKNITACVGSGTSEVSVEDTTLADAFSGASNVTCTISSITYENVEDFKIKTLYVITGKNNGSDSVIINEVGLCKQFYAGEASNTTLRFSSNKYLMVRQLLTTPITVAAGKDYQITLEVVDDLALTQN